MESLVRVHSTGDVSGGENRAPAPLAPSGAFRRISYVDRRCYRGRRVAPCRATLAAAPAGLPVGQPGRLCPGDRRSSRSSILVHPAPRRALSSQQELQQGIIGPDSGLIRSGAVARGRSGSAHSRSGTQLVATIAAQAEDGGAAQVRAVTSRARRVASWLRPRAGPGDRHRSRRNRGASVGAAGDVAEPFPPPSAAAESPAPPSEAPDPAALVTTQRQATPRRPGGRDRHWFRARRPGGRGRRRNQRGFALAVGAPDARAWSLTLEGAAPTPEPSSGPRRPSAPPPSSGRRPLSPLPLAGRVRCGHGGIMRGSHATCPAPGLTW